MNAPVRRPPQTALRQEKFRDPGVTATGEPRAFVEFKEMHTLWLNTGTLCNLTCDNCYIESSPRNDRLAYLTLHEATIFLDELETQPWPAEEIGFTGGEPFMNPDIIAMLEAVLTRGRRALVLTNAMRPMMKRADELRTLQGRFGDQLVVRVSVDHYGKDLHELERGPRSWQPTINGLRWLGDNGLDVRVAGRTCWGEPEEQVRQGYARLFEEQGIPVDASDFAALVLLPEMDARLDVPEITTRCWDILNVHPDDMMCATSRMVVKRKGASAPAVVACTLLPYDEEFELGRTLSEAARSVRLNHPHCSKFCVLGGGSCSAPSG